MLYRNLGAEQDYAFRAVNNTGLLQYRDEGFYNPISVGDYNHDGYTDVLLMCWRDGRKIDLYLNDKGTGRFILQDINFVAATNGSVMFGDLNNDGWLDIEFSGYGDSSARTLKTYLNDGDGTFTDSTPSILQGAFQGQSSLVDVNGDGTLDIISTGNGDNWVCLASTYINNIGADGKPTYTYQSESQTGIKGVSRANVLGADLNSDGRMDLVVNGEPSDGDGFRTRIYYQQADGTFSVDATYPVVPVNQDGGIAMGDWNGDGNMDIIVGGYIGTRDSDEPCYSSPLRVYENCPEQAGLTANTFPEAPASVTANYADGKIQITWTAGSDKESPKTALRYNLYVHNKTTGETFCLIPADRETGLLKTGSDLQTSLSSAVTSYSMTTLGDGDYIVGVQTLDQAFAGSRFTTAEFSTGLTGIHSTEVDSQC